MRWEARASERLRNGEVIEETIPVGENAVVVTSQRLLAFTPDGEGPNYRAVERPNVEGAALRHDGDTEWLEYTAKGAIGGLIAVGIGLTVDFGGMISLQGISTDGAGQVGIGGMLSMLTTITNLMGKVDDALLVGGLLALTFGLGAFGMYIESRTYSLVIDIAGEDDLHVRAPSDAQDQDRRLQSVLEGESTRNAGHEVDDGTGHDGTADDPIPAEPADPADVQGGRDVTDGD